MSHFPMNQIETDAPEQQVEALASQRKPYATPIMKDFGSVAEITRGVFPDYYMGS